MGGIGFMSHKYGVQAGYVNEMEIVTGCGNSTTCSTKINSDLFDCLRGGLGQCGIITSATLPLVQAPKVISIFKLFYLAENVKTFSEDVKDLVESRRIDMIHAFLKPCTTKCLSNILGASTFASSSSEFQSNIQDGESIGSLIFFLELGCYMWNTPNDVSCLDDIMAFLSSNTRCISGKVFNEQNDFQTYITKDPPVVETNKAHGTVPHPSFATVISEMHVVKLLQHHIASSSRGNDSTNEILIIPVKSNSALQSGSHVPMFPMPCDSDMSFFLLFLGSVIPQTEKESSEIMKNICAHHRKLYKLSLTLGAKRYSYDTITSEVCGESVWKDHYGEETWRLLCTAKRKYDPFHTLCPGVKMWGKSAHY